MPRELLGSRTRHVIFHRTGNWFLILHCGDRCHWSLFSRHWPRRFLLGCDVLLIFSCSIHPMCLQYPTRRMMLKQERVYRGHGLVAMAACKSPTHSCRPWRLVLDFSARHSLTIDLCPQRLLSTKGRFYLVAVKDNDIPGIRARMLGDYGLKSEVRSKFVYYVRTSDSQLVQITLHRRAGREHLFVLMFHR